MSFFLRTGASDCASAADALLFGPIARDTKSHLPAALLGVAVVVVRGKRASNEGWVGIFTRGSERGRDRHVRVGAPGARAALARGENAAQGQCRLHAAPGKPVMTQAD